MPKPWYFLESQTCRFFLLHFSSSSLRLSSKDMIQMSDWGEDDMPTAVDGEDIAAFRPSLLSLLWATAGAFRYWGRQRYDIYAAAAFSSSSFRASHWLFADIRILLHSIEMRYNIELLLLFFLFAFIDAIILLYTLFIAMLLPSAFSTSVFRRKKISYMQYYTRHTWARFAARAMFYWMIDIYELFAARAMIYVTRALRVDDAAFLHARQMTLW